MNAPTATEQFPDISDRVARGAALLDLRAPGWAARVDPDTLDLEDCWHCVIGQLYRPEQTVFKEPFEIGAIDLFGLDAYGFDDNAPILVEHGFSAPRRDSMAEFAALTSEWRSVVTARRVDPHRIEQHADPS
ncbi:hypothetical protein [Streptosporangium sp. NPDC002721]|uniref:hypothetical protein n=1 Tax=Streptosporangium sp. NPDC002721 TaxID=3366188 RepID=UPI00368FF1EF